MRTLTYPRDVDDKMAFLCHHDPVPTEGEVIGLAVPSRPHELVDEVAVGRDAG